MEPACQVVSSHDGTVGTLCLVGELDLWAAPLVREHLDSLMRHGATRVIADLGSLDFIDSTGLSILIAAQRRLLDRGGELVLKDPNPRVTKVLEITALTKLFTIVTPQGARLRE